MGDEAGAWSACEAGSNGLGWVDVWGVGPRDYARHYILYKECGADTRYGGLRAVRAQPSNGCKKCSLDRLVRFVLRCGF